MKHFWTIFLMLLFLASCGTKRKIPTTAKKTTSVGKRYPTKKTEKEGLYPLPEDHGKFVKFPITSVEDYIGTFTEIAQFEMKAYGIPASITLAQGILESGSGKSTLTLKSNNHFGIKCHRGWEGDVTYHDDDAKGECFRKYNHPMYSFRDHSIFLSSRARYSFLFDLKITNYKAWAKGLRQAGYATDKRYPQKLIALIEKYKLYLYDKAVIKLGHAPKKTVKTYNYQVHVVEKGDTLYAISRKYFVAVSELKKLNQLKDNTLTIGQQLIIKSKKEN